MSVAIYAREHGEWLALEWGDPRGLLGGKLPRWAR